MLRVPTLGEDYVKDWRRSLCIDGSFPVEIANPVSGL